MLTCVSLMLDVVSAHQPNMLSSSMTRSLSLSLSIIIIIINEKIKVA